MNAIEHNPIEGQHALIPCAEFDDVGFCEFLDAIDKNTSILRMWLFGSRARGDWNEESDVDLFYTTSGPRLGKNEVNALCKAVDRLTSSHFIDFDFVYLPDQDIPERENVPGDTVNTIVREGWLLYVRA